MVTGNMIAQSNHTQNIQQLSQSNSMVAKTNLTAQPATAGNQALLGQ